MTFYKIKQDGRNNKPYWVTKGYNEYGEIWQNLRGGWCLKSDKDEILSIAEYPDKDEFINANRKEVFSYLIKPNSDYGWLAPDGTFYGCDYANHSDLATFYFDKDDIELEKEGWVKIYRSCEYGEPVYSQTRISFQQRMYLEDHNVKYVYC